MTGSDESQEDVGEGLQSEEPEVPREGEPEGAGLGAAEEETSPKAKSIRNFLNELFDPIMRSLSQSSGGPIMPPSQEILESHRREAREALNLLRYSIRSGLNVSDPTIDKLKQYANRILGKPEATINDCIEFEKAYRDLLEVTRPVTYETLSACEPEYSTVPLRYSIAFKMSVRLWICTIAFALFIIITQARELLLDTYSPLGEESSGAIIAQHKVLLVLKLILPFMYGALGALVYLLRRCHSLTHERTFDPLRRSEYMNRALLGAISGGVILLFLDPDSLELGESTRLTGVSLAFLTGYNCDFLFSTLERIAAAILPKVATEGKSTTSTASSSVTAKFDVDKLLDMYKASTDDNEKKFLQDLIDKLLKRV